MSLLSRGCHKADFTVRQTSGHGESVFYFFTVATEISILCMDDYFAYEISCSSINETNVLSAYSEHFLI